MISSHQLTNEQIVDVKALARRCKRHDGHILPFHPHLLMECRMLPCNLLYYRKQKLIGFLSVFFFYEDACEITVMVDPTWRRHRIASQLVTTIIPVVQSRGIENLIFSSPKAVNTDWLTARDFNYQISEYQMQYKGPPIVDPFPLGLRFSQATVDDVPTLVEIDVASFFSEKLMVEDRFYQLLEDPRYTLFILYEKNRAIGKAHFYEADGILWLSDVAILVNDRGRGLGEALVTECIRYALENRGLPIRLDVESNNQVALNLYLKLGFKTVNVVDFWKISLAKLNAIAL